jgi:predicted transcriptional regulator YdeE
MEKYILKNDVKVFCTTATSFPDGIKDAFMKIEKMLPKNKRTFYGISYKNGAGAIVYRAAMSESYEGESIKYDFETFTIIKGEYLAETVNWRKNPEVIGSTFQKMLADRRMDQNFPCIEKYINDEEVVCMVKIILNN